MPDQANRLRELVRRASIPRTVASRTRLIVVSGGKGGVGTTTVAANLAIALAQAGRAVALVDADADGGCIAAMCRIEERATIVDVLSGRTTLADALVDCPPGVAVLAGAWGVDLTATCSPAAVERFTAQLQDLDPRASLAVIDAGNGTHSLARQLWQAADQVLLVTGPELVSVLSSYAVIKTLSGGDSARRISTLVNRSPSQSAAAEVHSRLEQACLRFLGLRLGPWWWLPDELRVAESGRAGELYLSDAPECPATDCIRQLVAGLEVTPCQFTERRSGATIVNKSSTGSHGNADTLGTVR